MSSEFIKKVKLPLFLLAILIFPIFFGQHISIEIKSICYAISLSMKTVLEFLLPYIIFSFVFFVHANRKRKILMDKNICLKKKSKQECKI